MKRQRGRNRGGSGAQGGGGGKPQQHNANRSFESNGPENVKIRGNAQHVYEKYQQLARDASSSGDRVLAENYLQHAEHYFRVVRAVQPNRPVAEIIGRDSISSGYDIDFEDETGANAEPEAASDGDNASGSDNNNNGDNGDQRQNDQNRGEWQSRDRQRDDRPRDDRGYNRDDRPRDGQRDQQQDRYRDDRPRDDRPRDDRPRDERPRDDRPRDDRPRDDRPRDGQRDGQRDDRPPRRDRFGRDRFERNDRPARDPMAVVEPEATPFTPASEPEEGQHQLRSQDGSLSPAPAFLQARTDSPPRAVETEDGEARKPRRRRAPRSFEGGEGEAPASAETEEV